MNVNHSYIDKRQVYCDLLLSIKLNLSIYTHGNMLNKISFNFLHLSTKTRFKHVMEIMSYTHGNMVKENSFSLPQVYHIYVTSFHHMLTTWSKPHNLIECNIFSTPLIHILYTCFCHGFTMCPTPCSLHMVFWWITWSLDLHQ